MFKSFQVPWGEIKVIAFIVLYLSVVGLLARQFPIELWAQNISSTGFWFVLVYVLLFVLRGFFLFPPLYFFLGLHFVYGFWETIVIFMLGSQLSLMVSFYVSRFIFEQEKCSNLRHKIQKSFMLKKMEAHPYTYYMVVNGLGLNFDIPNYLAGYFRLCLPYLMILLAVVQLVTSVIFLLFLDGVKPFFMPV